MVTNMSPTRLLRLAQVVERIGLSRSTIYARVAEGRFPRPVEIGGRRVAWVEGEVQEWIEAQVVASRPKAGAE